MKHRRAYNVILTILLLCSIVGWFLAGFSAGVQSVPNPTAQLQLAICTILIIGGSVGLLVINITAYLRHRRDKNK